MTRFYVDRWKATTESGSVYIIEPDPTFPGRNIVSWTQDGIERQYRDVRVGNLAVGERFIYEGQCVRRDHRTPRITTPVVSIEPLDWTTS